MTTLLLRILVFILVLGILRYLWVRFRRIIPKKLHWPTGFLFIALLFVTFLYRLLPTDAPAWIGALGFAIGGFWMVFLSNWLVACLSLDLVFVIRWFRQRVFGFGIRTYEIRKHLSYSRSHWIPLVLGLTVIVTMTMFAVGWPAQLRFRVNYEQVHLTRQTTQKVRAAILTDVHFDPLFQMEKWDAMLDSLKRIQPDVILIPGDLTDLSIADMERGGYGDALAKLHAPLGVFMISGNHEAYMLRRDPDLFRYFSSKGIEWLDESSICVPGLCITGRTDPNMGKALGISRKPLQEIQPDSQVLERQAWLVLDHQPFGLTLGDLGPQEAKPDLGISGHTHAGQFFPWTYVIRFVWPLSRGRGELAGVPWITSSGFGQWGPALRIGSSTELLIVDFIGK